MIKNWVVIGGIATAVAAGVYVFWGPITERKKRKRGMVPGLLNLGSTCFLNSLLQGLAACPSFIRWLERFSGASTRISHRKNQLSTTLLQLLKALSSDESGDEDVLDAGCVLEVLRLYRWHISSFEEQDAHELFHVLSSSLEEENDLQPKVTHLFDMHSLESLPEQHEKTMTCRSRAPLHPIPCSWKFQHPFHGRLISNMSCKNCEQKSPVQYDSFESLSLSIPLPHWGRPISLDQCLQHFISSEAIKEVECVNCTKLQQGTVVNEPILKSRRTTFVKQLKLGKLPQCLCIHLQRLTWSSEGAPIKRQEHVQFTEYLSMDHYKHNTFTQRSHQQIKHPANPLKAENTEDTREKSSNSGTETMSHNNNNPLLNGTSSSVFLQSSGASSHLNFMCDYRSSEHLFQLMAVVVHHGDMRSGHFVTYRRSPSSSCTSQWLWASDDLVRKASLHEVLSSNAYMLFYERVRRLNITLQAEE
ncbi:ubiquitin carboxyl-terminal hydrolase 30 [Thalassophryne amazonica]|uniref:ubiquitin carboxyl-terminal hydrolase 30 n=1 Tax=Thalassophryne amazonica TaxID=390379 RepID=UPI0014724428|nr:ubiquitin carboxyl-terminal hydrolase 30 [Thalassophryne amazonica]XP_034026150.1 ubiquitin carboxyl-terminal hydrolase 30 [Thalassophryne amazonica]